MCIRDRHSRRARSPRRSAPARRRARGRHRRGSACLLYTSTNDFIASGKDGYTALGNAYNAGRYVNTYLLYTQSFVDYVLAKTTVARPARSDYSHQTVVTKAGFALP